MKKSIFVFAIILAGVLTSCGDTNYCYELTTKVTILGVTTTTVSYVWGTANEIEVTKEELKNAQLNMGISEDCITITAKRTNKSQEDCRK
jgi:hypothetical protein